MEKSTEILLLLNDRAADIKRRYKVKRLGVFGSHIKGRQGEDSDLDVLVEFEEPVSLFEYLDLKEYLEGLLAVDVDLVSVGALNRRIGKKILKEVELV